MSFILSVLPALVAALSLLFYYLVTRKYNYWLRKKVPHLKPSFIFGNYGSNILMKKNIAQTVNDLCDQFPDQPYFGAYYGTEPTLIVKSPELLKQVLTKDFFYFNGREASPYNDKEFLTKSLFFNHSDEWKVLRQNLTPTFSSAKMKNMFAVIVECSKVLEELLVREYEKSEILEVRSLMARYTMDCIGNCIFGVNTDVMGDNPRNPYKIFGSSVFEISDSRGIKNIIRAVWPSVFYGLGFKVFPDKIKNFFNKAINKVIKDRSKKIQLFQNILHLMLELKEKQYISGDSLNNFVNRDEKQVKVEITDELIISQTIAFFAAGYETSATTLTHTLYELAKKPECQEKAIEEIDEFLKKHSYKLVYECISDLPYLQACVSETLRLYPLLGNLTREVMSDYRFESGLRVDKGVRVHIPVYHLQRHPDHFPEPDVYRPERFLPEELNNIKPFTYLPFGEGPRICIGMRFAKMQIYSGLVTIFKKYRVKLAADMPRELQLEPRAIVTQTKGNIKLQFVLRTDVDNTKFT